MGVIEASDRARKGVQMTGKQGAAEWLRGIVDGYEANGAQSCSGMAKMFGIYCEHVASCRDCMTKMMTAIADRIDAERALPEGMEWPRFEDGGLVRIGDELEFEGKTMRVYLATLNNNRWTLLCEHDGIDGRLIGSYGERVNRPAPEVLDADGVPIKVGDVVYFVGGSGVRYAVKDIGFEPDGAFVDIIDEEGRYSTMVNPENLTHERPDSWRLWGDDLDMAVKVGEVDKVEMMRRAKALAKAGE